MTERRFLCFYEGHGNEWEAISVDFDIAVSSDSLDEVKALLKSAILTYIEDASNQEPSARERLLNRRMPTIVRLRWLLKLRLHEWRSQNANSCSEGRFEVACPA